MIEINDNECKIEGDAITIMAETIILFRLLTPILNIHSFIPQMMMENAPDVMLEFLQALKVEEGDTYV